MKIPPKKSLGQHFLMNPSTIDKILEKAGVTAAHTVLPVLGVPIESASLKGLDSLLSTVQMPGGIPVGTLAIGNAGAKNAALLAIAILALKRPPLKEKLRAYRKTQAKKVLNEKLP